MGRKYQEMFRSRCFSAGGGGGKYRKDLAGPPSVEVGNTYGRHSAWARNPRPLRRIHKRRGCCQKLNIAWFLSICFRHVLCMRMSPHPLTENSLCRQEGPSKTRKSRDDKRGMRPARIQTLRQARDMTVLRETAERHKRHQQEHQGKKSLLDRTVPHVNLPRT